MVLPPYGGAQTPFWAPAEDGCEAALPGATWDQHKAPPPRDGLSFLKCLLVQTSVLLQLPHPISVPESLVNRAGPFSLSAQRVANISIALTVCLVGPQPLHL